MASSGIMKDSYVGGIVSSSCIQQNDDLPFCVNITDEQEQTTNEVADDKIDSILFGGKTKEWRMQSANQTDEDKIIHLTCTDETKTTNINLTEEYNIGYSGLSILPWEDFVFNPRVFNDLFYTERNQRITYDPEEVNVFFHGKNVMPPTLGDISENGKSWNIDVDNISDLRKVRKLLTERCSVFGVTLQYKEKRFSKPVRAPCVVLMDPSQGGIGDRLYTTLTKAMDTIHNQRRVCVEINLNICVERWCKRVLLTDCKAVGAKLYVTNGEEYTPLNETTEDMICCALCFPIWLLQTCIYKLHRFVTYDDFRSDFDAEDLFLHGAFQDAQYQREQIFKGAGDNEVFRTRSTNQTDTNTLQALGTYKFVCVKKVEKTEEDSSFKEHKTATFSVLVDKRKERVLQKSQKLLENQKLKKTSSNREENVPNELETDSKVQDVSVTSENRQHDVEYKENKPKTYTNEAFTSSDDEREENEFEKIPRIPEITSVLCPENQDEDNNIEVPFDFQTRDDSVFIKKTDSLDQDALDFSFRKEKCPDSKSMTAVCSFQMSDSGGESEVSGDTDEEDQVDIPARTSKENLIDEMKKIERTLPKIQSKVDNFNIKESNDTMKGKTGKKAKSKKKIMVGQAFREITKTTQMSVTKDKHLDDHKSKMNVNSKTSEVSSNDSKIPDVPKNDTKNKDAIKNENINVENNNTVVSQTDKIRTNETNNRDEGGENGEFDMRRNELKSVQAGDETDNNVSKKESSERSSDRKSENISNGIQENAVLDFNIDNMSSDGDDVEVIYQSQKGHRTIGADLNLSENNERRTSLGLDEVVKANRPFNQTSDSTRLKELAFANDKSSHKKIDKVSITQDNEIEPAVSCSDNGTNINHDTLYGVTKVETALDITDIDDIDDDPKDKTDVTVPPLKLNIGETLGKKVKRGSRQYNSNRKYLGASIPNKAKRTHKD